MKEQKGSNCNEKHEKMERTFPDRHAYAEPDRLRYRRGRESERREDENGGAFSSAEGSIYGKIIGITGNEVEMAIAKRPTDDGSGADDLKGDVITPNENDAPMIGGETIEDPTDNLEFTGETKSFTIPAGVKITNMGQEMNLSGLKKGDIISVSIDPENPDTVLTVEKVK